MKAKGQTPAYERKLAVLFFAHGVYVIGEVRRFEGGTTGKGIHTHGGRVGEVHRFKAGIVVEDIRADAGYPGEGYIALGRGEADKDTVRLRDIRRTFQRTVYHGSGQAKKRL
jgi:hypothetical protein